MDKYIPTLRNVEQCCLMRWWEGWRVGGPWPAWPTGVLGLIGLGLGICVLNWDYHVIQHFAGKSTQQWQAELAEGVHWPPAHCLIRFCPALLGSWVVLFTFLCIHPHCALFHSVLSVPLHSDLFCYILFNNIVLFPLCSFGSPASIHPSLFHFIMLISVQFSSVHISSSASFCSINPKPNSVHPDPVGSDKRFLIWRPSQKDGIISQSLSKPLQVNRK